MGKEVSALCRKRPRGPKSGPLSTGEHRGMGAGVSKVRSLKMDRKVWTETLIEVGRPLLFTCIGDLAAAWVSQSHLLHLPDPSTLELKETFGTI